MFDLTGKLAFITGGTSGVGRAVAARFAEAGASVAIVGRRESGARIAQEMGATFVQADISTEDGNRRALATAEEALGGRLDAVVLNAGVDTGGPPIEETTTEELDRGFAVNFRAVWWGLKYAPRHMDDGGSVTLTSSLLSTNSAPGYGGYAAAKAGVSSLARSGALELAPRRIRVNCVLPGTTLSEMTPPEHWEVPLMEILVPMQRVAEPERDMVGLFHFLASDEAGYITGQNIAVDGGLTAGFGIPLLEARGVEG